MPSVRSASTNTARGTSDSSAAGELLEDRLAVALDRGNQAALTLQRLDHRRRRARGEALPRHGDAPRGRVDLDLGAFLGERVELRLRDYQVGQRFVDEVALVNEGEALGDHRAHARAL